MKKPIIHYVRKRFSDFCLESNDRIKCLRAYPDDDFAFFMAENPEMEAGFNVGFRKVKRGYEFIDGVRRNSFVLCTLLKEEAIYSFSYLKETKYSPHCNWLLVPKNDLVHAEILRYEKYKLDLKKRDIFRRHGKDFPIMEKPLFSYVFESGGFHDELTYGFIRDNCIYTIDPCTAGECGDEAFYVFSDNLDAFFSLVKELAAEDFNLISHASFRELPCT